MKYTTLVNKSDLFQEKKIKNRKLIEIVDINQSTIEIEEETAKSYQKLEKYLKENNIEIGITSAYQKELIDNSSEHLTGLAIDIAIKKDNQWIKEDNSTTRNDYQTIHQSAANFGFIVRYPKEKESITGVPYKPYHLRYVGMIPASIIMKEKITLEEYLRSFRCILFINKPKNITSFDVVNEISHLFGIKRVGHTGTLDPLATGVMLVAVGQATKIVELLTAEDKEYIADVELGYQTDTYDNTGIVIRKTNIPDNLALEDTIKKFKKTYYQEVPIYSAVKVKGKKLYEYARKKEKVELPKKEVTIKEIELLARTNTTFRFRAKVTKGCYIRSLINDIGIELNTLATMTSLTRTKQGNIAIDATNTLKEIKENHYQKHDIEEVLSYPVVKVEKSLESKIKNGVSIDNNWNITDKVFIHSHDNKLLGIYQVKGKKLITWKNFT